MKIYIPTYGRPKDQHTLRQLLAAGLAPVLVVQEREYKDYLYLSSKAQIMVLPNHIRTIAPTRQFIYEHGDEGDEFCMVDDDLLFYHRRQDDPTKLRDITPMELEGAFTRMADSLQMAGHVGFAPREGANRNTDDIMWNTRIMRVLAYSRPALRDCKVRFDDMEVMEDFHVALTLLEHGYQNMILNKYAHNQAGGSAAKGGCSHFRTPELQARNAHELARRHPKFVKVTEKATKTAWGGGTRTDVTVYWKKALASGTSS